MSAKWDKSPGCFGAGVSSRILPAVMSWFWNLTSVGFQVLLIIKMTVWQTLGTTPARLNQSGRGWFLTFVKSHKSAARQMGFHLDDQATVRLGLPAQGVLVALLCDLTNIRNQPLHDCRIVLVYNVIKRL